MSTHHPAARSWSAAVAVGAVALASGAGVVAGRGSWVAGIAMAGLAACLLAVALHRLTASSSGGVVPAWDRVRDEIERARRLNSSLVVARLRLAPPVQPQPVADRVEQVLRGSDSVWVEGRSILVLLADADRGAAQHGIDRALRTVDDAVAETLTAAFPGDEVTLGGLMDRLYPPRRVRPLSGRGTPSATATVIAVDEERQATA